MLDAHNNSTIRMTFEENMTYSKHTTNKAKLFNIKLLYIKRASQSLRVPTLSSSSSFSSLSGGIKLPINVKISGASHLLLPCHKFHDQACVPVRTHK